MNRGDAIEPVMDNKNNLVHRKKWVCGFVCNCTEFTISTNHLPFGAFRGAFCYHMMPSGALSPARAPPSDSGYICIPKLAIVREGERTELLPTWNLDKIHANNESETHHNPAQFVRLPFCPCAAASYGWPWSHPVVTLFVSKPDGYWGRLSMVQ